MIKFYALSAFTVATAIVITAVVVRESKQNSIESTNTAITRATAEDDGNERTRAAPPRRELDATSLSDFWRIDDPTWISGDNNNVFQLDYEFNDMVEDSMVSWTYWDKNCQAGGVEVPPAGVGYQWRVETPSDPLGDGTGTRTHRLVLTPDASLPSNPAVYSGDAVSAGGSWYGTLEICARASLKTQNGIEVNFLENLLRIRYAFTDDFFTIDNVNVQRPLVDLTNVELGVKLRAYECSETAGDRISQGMVLKICIEPVPRAVADGFRMKQIDYFRYEKNVTNPETGEITTLAQDAVVDKGSAPDGFSRLSCDRGSQRCTVETLLLAPFYAGNGTVDAYGLATMQFGDHATDEDGDFGGVGGAQNGYYRDDDAFDGDYRTDDGGAFVADDSVRQRELGVRELQQEPAATDDVQQEFEVPIELEPSSETTDGGAPGLRSNRSSTGGKPSVRVSILVLWILNALAVVVLVFQHPIFRGKCWMHLQPSTNEETSSGGNTRKDTLSDLKKPGKDTPKDSAAAADSATRKKSRRKRQKQRSAPRAPFLLDPVTGTEFVPNRTRGSKKPQRHTQRTHPNQTTHRPRRPPAERRPPRRPRANEEEEDDDDDSHVGRCIVARTNVTTL